MSFTVRFMVKGLDLFPHCLKSYSRYGLGVRVLAFAMSLTVGFRVRICTLTQIIKNLIQL